MGFLRNPIEIRWKFWIFWIFMENDDPKIPQKLHVSGACLGMGVRLNGRTADATPSSYTSVKWGLISFQHGDDGIFSILFCMEKP
jgi:hypothetical protein